MFRHTHSLGALLILSAVPFLFACDDDSAILGPNHVDLEQLGIPQMVTLEIGQTVRLTAAGTDPDGAKREIQWSSSNPQVATVSHRGVVRALAKGSVTITADCGSYRTITTVSVIPAKAG